MARKIKRLPESLFFTYFVSDGENSVAVCKKLFSLPRQLQKIWQRKLKGIVQFFSVTFTTLEKLKEFFSNFVCSFCHRLKMQIFKYFLKVQIFKYFWNYWLSLSALKICKIGNHILRFWDNSNWNPNKTNSDWKNFKILWIC